MRELNRRRFLQSTLAGAGALAAAPLRLSMPEPARAAASYRGSDIVALGRTGIRVSRLAHGTGFNGYNRSSDHTRLGEKSFDALLRHSLDSGITFLDMADLYGTHPFVRNVVKGIPREKLVMLSKIWPRQESWNKASGGAKEEVDRYRKELDTDRIDVCLIHCMMNAKWPDEFARVRDELSELKEKGVIRAAGVSCHDLGALKTAAEHPWVDVIFARINNMGGSRHSMDGTAEEVSGVLKQARANGKAVVGMKIFGAGKLVQPEQKDASLRYVLTNGLVDAITIGMLKPAETDDALQRMSQI